MKKQKNVQLSEQQKDVLRGMLNHYRDAYKSTKNCDKYIDEAIALEVEFADSNEQLEDYLIVSGRASHIANAIMKLSCELKKEIDRISNLLEKQ